MAALACLAEMESGFAISSAQQQNQADGMRDGNEHIQEQEERRGEWRRGEERRGEAPGGDTLIRKHPHLWRGDRGLCRRQRASAVMASWPHGLTAEGGWMLGRWAVLDVERGFGATGCHLESWTADRTAATWLESWGLARTSKCTLHTHTAH